MTNEPQQAKEEWENKGGIELITLHPFIGENATELTVEKGKKLQGIASNGIWYMVKNEDTKETGLIPCSYLQQIN